MTKTHPCKFCQKPVTVVIDDDYAALADPYGLMRLLSCNNCADYESARRALFRHVKVLCELLIQRAVAKDDVPKVRESLETLTKKFMRLYSEHHDLALPPYEAEIVEAMMGKPSHFGQVLAHIPRMFQQRALI